MSRLSRRSVPLALNPLQVLWRDLKIRMLSMIMQGCCPLSCLRTQLLPPVTRLRSNNWNVWGYEPGAEAATDFVVNRRDAISARFDGIFSNNVIEHFRNPVAQFGDFHSLLKVGGTMAHSSPCYEYAYAYSRFHTVFLVGRSPYVLAERTGFKVLDRIQEGEYINYLFERI